MSDSHTSVGILRKPHGLSGAFSFMLTRELRSLKKYPTHFFLEVKGTFIPYFVSKVDFKDIFSGYITFEDVDNLEKAKALVNLELYLDEKAIGTFFKKAADEYGFLMGYTAFDKGNELGLITGILSHPAQILAEIDVNGNEVLIPIVEGLVIEIDKRKKRIVFDVPEGLI